MIAKTISIKVGIIEVLQDSLQMFQNCGFTLFQNYWNWPGINRSWSDFKDCKIQKTQAFEIAAQKFSRRNNRRQAKMNMSKNKDWIGLYGWKIWKIQRKELNNEHLYSHYVFILRGKLIKHSRRTTWYISCVTKMHSPLDIIS